jgi:hypothetical protein
MASFTVSYSQSDNTAQPGEITFNGVTMTASGRLDAVGDVVFATGFTFDANGDFDVEVECTRTSYSKMRVRVVFLGPTHFDFNAAHYERFPIIEKVVEDVPLDFVK